MYGTSSVPVKYVIVEGNYSLAGYGFEKSSFGARQGWGGAKHKHKADTDKNRARVRVMYVAGVHIG